MTQNSTLKALTLALLLSGVGFNAVQAKDEKKEDVTAACIVKKGAKVTAKVLAFIYGFKYIKSALEQGVGFAPKADDDSKTKAAEILVGAFAGAVLKDDAEDFAKAVTSFVTKQTEPVTSAIPLLN